MKIRLKHKSPEENLKRLQTCETDYATLQQNIKSESTWGMTWVSLRNFASTSGLLTPSKRPAMFDLIRDCCNFITLELINEKTLLSSNAANSINHTTEKRPLLAIPQKNDTKIGNISTNEEIIPPASALSIIDQRDTNPFISLATTNKSPTISLGLSDLDSFRLSELEESLYYSIIETPEEKTTSAIELAQNAPPRFKPDENEIAAFKDALNIPLEITQVAALASVNELKRFFFTHIEKKEETPHPVALNTMKPKPSIKASSTVPSHSEEDHLNATLNQINQHYNHIILGLILYLIFKIKTQEYKEYNLDFFLNNTSYQSSILLKALSGYLDIEYHSQDKPLEEKIHLNELLEYIQSLKDFQSFCQTILAKGTLINKSISELFYFMSESIINDIERVILSLSTLSDKIKMTSKQFVFLTETYINPENHVLVEAGKNSFAACTSTTYNRS
jgi:hypothetical protein